MFNILLALVGIVLTVPVVVSAIIFLIIPAVSKWNAILEDIEITEKKGK